MEVGEDWVYRPKARTSGAPFFCARIEKIKADKTPKFQIRLLDGEEEGLRTWVTKVTLKSPWNERDAWSADDERYASAVAVSVTFEESSEFRAVERIVDEIWQARDFDVMRIGWNRVDRGLLLIRDLPTAKKVFGQDLEELLADPLTFTDRFGVLVAPWAATLRWAQRACTVLADDVMRWVDREDKKLRGSVIHGETIYFGRGETWERSPAQCAESFNEQNAVLEALRAWCGVEPVERFDELSALREEVGRLNSIVESALASLRRTGHDKEADALQRTFGYRPQEGPRPSHR